MPNLISGDIPKNYSECLKFLDEDVWGINQTVRINLLLKMPSCKRNITINTTSMNRHENHKYYLKFPELVFKFDLLKEEDFDHKQPISVSMKCFYSSEGKLYGCILPNQNDQHDICFGGDFHFTKFFNRKDFVNTKKVIKECIDEFFCNSFSIYSDRYYRKDLANFEQMLINPYQVYETIEGKKHEFYSRVRGKFLLNPQDFSMSPEDFFKYWHNNSSDPTFKIFSNNVVQSIPLQHDGNIDDIITFNQFMKLSPVIDDKQIS